MTLPDLIALGIGIFILGVVVGHRFLPPRIEGP